MSYEAGRWETGTANPGSLNIYVYHPDQRDVWGDHFYPTGRVLPFDRTPGDFGPEFVARPDVIPVLGRWYCYELMVKANTPGQRDGRIAMWLDGKLIADFPNLRLRETNALKIDRFTHRSARSEQHPGRGQEMVRQRSRSHVLHRPDGFHSAAERANEASDCSVIATPPRCGQTPCESQPDSQDYPGADIVGQETRREVHEVRIGARQGG